MAILCEIFVACLLCLLNARASAQDMSTVTCVCNEGSPSDMFATADGNGPAVRQMETSECLGIDLNPSATQMMYAVVIGESLYYLSKTENISVDSCVSVPMTNSVGTTMYVLVAIPTTQIPNKTTTVMPTTITEAPSTVTTNVPTTIEPFTESTAESTTQTISSSTTVAKVESTTQLMTTTLATKKVCEHGWHLLEDGCYMFQGTHKSWLDANLFCQRNNGHLVYIESQDEQNLIANYIQHHPNIDTAFWIGANDRLTEGDWRWDDPNGVDKHVTYTNWGHGEPNSHHEEDCVNMIGHDMHWSDESCEVHHGFICEADPMVVIVTPAPDNAGHCDDGWRAYDGHCYLFKTHSADTLTWSQAQSQCAKFGAYLVVITSTNEQNFIYHSLSHIITHVVHDDIKSSLWIGATDHAREGHWQWIMGEQSTNVAFTAWGPGEPNNHINHNEDCAVVRGTYSYEWNDYPCDLTLHYICEKEKGSTLQPIVVG